MLCGPGLHRGPLSRVVPQSYQLLARAALSPKPKPLALAALATLPCGPGPLPSSPWAQGTCQLWWVKFITPEDPVRDTGHTWMGFEFWLQMGPGNGALQVADLQR